MAEDKKECKKCLGNRIIRINDKQGADYVLCPECHDNCGRLKDGR